MSAASPSVVALHEERTSGYPPLPLWRSFFWSLVGVSGFAGSQWAIIVLLAKLGTAAILGVYAYALAVTAPVLLFVQMNLRLVQAVDSNREFRFADYLGVRAIGSVLALPVLALFVLVTEQPFAVMIVIGVLACAKVIDGLSDVVHGLLQQRERTDKQAISLLIRGTLQVALLAVVLMSTGDVRWSAVAVAVGSVVSLLLYDIPLSGRILRDEAEPATGWVRLSYLRGRANVRLQLARRALPLGIMAVLGSLYQNIPRYFVERAMGLEAVGYYSAVFYLTFVGYTVVAAMGNATAPTLARLYTADAGRFRRMSFALAGFGALLGGIGMLLAAWQGDWLLGLLYRAEYAQYQGLLVWVMLSSCFWYAATLLGFAAIAAQRFRLQAYLHAVAALATVIAAPPLLKAYGLEGGAMALTVGVFPLLIGECVIVWSATRARSSGRATAPVGGTA